MIEIIEPGPLTSVQDATGRPDWRHLGVPVGGAADAWSARLANLLVGNVEDAPLLNIWESKNPVQKKGPIELQYHGDPLYFRNIFVKELPD